MSNTILFLCFFFTIPTLMVIVVELYSLQGTKSSENISFWTWTFTNPAGVVMLPLFIYFILLLDRVKWKFEDLTSINISASLGVPLVFSGILAINSYIFNLNQEATKVSIKDAIIAEMRLMRAEDKAEFEKKFAEDKAANDKKFAEDKAANDKKFAEDKAANDKKFAEDKAEYIRQRAEDKANYDKLIKDIGLNVNNLNIDKAVREALEKKSS